VALNALGLAEAAPGIEVDQRGQMLIYGGGGALGNGNQIAPVVTDGPVLGRGVVQRVAVDLSLLKPGEVGADGAEVGAQRVSGQRRVLEVIGVLGEQLCVLRTCIQNSGACSPLAEGC
jgi:hypothetical protein